MDDADGTEAGDGDSDPDGKRDTAGGDGPTWAALFERASARGIEESAVREALARRREGDG